MTGTGEGPFGQAPRFPRSPWHPGTATSGSRVGGCSGGGGGSPGDGPDPSFDIHPSFLRQATTASAWEGISGGLTAAGSSIAFMGWPILEESLRKRPDPYAQDVHRLQPGESYAEDEFDPDRPYSLPQGHHDRPPGLLPPSKGSRTETCIAKWNLYTGIDSDSCYQLASDERRGVCRVLNIDVTDMEHRVQVDGGDTADVLILYKCWANLIDNLDLVAWACCLYGVDALAVHDFIHAIDRRWPTPRIRVKFDGTGWVTWPGVGGGVIHADSVGGDTGGVYVVGGAIAHWNIARDAFQSGNANDMACQILDITATLFHEASHLPHGGTLPISGPDFGVFFTECETSYQIENAFRWALWRRYPDVLQSPCCSNFVAAMPTLFGKTRGSWGTADCVSGTVPHSPTIVCPNLSFLIPSSAP